MSQPATCRVLIVGDIGDPHVLAVLQHLRGPGIVVVDADSIRRTLDWWDADGWVLRDTTGSPSRISEHSTTRGWIRRYGPPDWDHGVRIGSHAAAVLAARLTLLGALMRDSRVDWLTTSEHLAAAENKIVQQDAAHSLGIRTPATVIGASLSRVASTVGDPFVAKPLAVASFETDGQTRVAYAEAVAAANLAGVDILEAPFLFQELIKAETHLRVVTVADRALVCAQSAVGLPVDWRRADLAHESFAASYEHDDIAQRAVALAHAMDVGYSSQDWVVQDGEAYFLDLNPAGQWAFLPDEISNTVSRSIAVCLDEELDN
ncbi:MAG TPA: hypothetical protein VGK17_08670 [Propionicimonas sp.]|jgi:hypothetical protein